MIWKKTLVAFLTGVLAVGVVYVKQVDAVNCYQCDHVAHPRDCASRNTCKDDEMCSVMGYAQPDGHFYFNTGCRKTSSCPAPGAVGKRDFAFCNLCCDSDYCNKALCDRQHVAHEGRRCLKCGTVEHPTHCGTVTECKPGETCFTQEIMVFGEKRFRLGCAYQKGCIPTTNTYRSIMAKRAAGQCLECCDHENCNADLCGNTGSHTGQAATTKKPAPAVTTRAPIIASRTTAKPSPPQGFTFIPVSNGCMYKGHTYKEGQTWIDGCDYNCTCTSASRGHYVCTDFCPTYVYLPSRCKLVKTPGECCAKPVCNTTITTTTNFTSSVLLDHCYYKGNTYKQDEVWRDACDLECTCIQANAGHYRCQSLCYTWTLPKACHLDPPKPGKCCKTPSCPAHFTIHYPPNYVEN